MWTSWVNRENVPWWRAMYQQCDTSCEDDDDDDDDDGGDDDDDDDD